MSVEQIILVLLGIIGVLACAVASIAWRKVTQVEVDAARRCTELMEKMHVTELSLVSRYVDRQALRDVLDEKLRPVHDRLDLLTHWVEAQSGFPQLHPKLGGD